VAELLFVPSESVVPFRAGPEAVSTVVLARLCDVAEATNRLGGVWDVVVDSGLEEDVASELTVSTLAGRCLGLFRTTSLKLGGGASPLPSPATGTPNFKRLCVELTKAICSGVGPAEGYAYAV